MEQSAKRNSFCTITVMVGTANEADLHLDYLKLLLVIIPDNLSVTIIGLLLVKRENPRIYLCHLE